MSEIFHKSCYTSRSPGYKYRTLSTNTGDRKTRETTEDNAFAKKFKELRKAIVIRVNKEVTQTHKARESIIEKFGKLDAKIDSMLELQNTVTNLRNDLQIAGDTLVDMIQKVEKIESVSSIFSLQSQRASYRSQKPIMEENESFDDSIVTHI